MALGFSPNGSHLAVGRWNGEVLLYDAARLDLQRELIDGGKTITCLAFEPDGAGLVAAGMTGALLWWTDATSGGPERIGQELGWVHKLMFSANGERLVTASQKGPVVLWDCAKREAISTLGTVQDGAYSVAISHDGRIVAAGGAKGPIWIWSPESKLPPKQLGSDIDTVTSLSFSGDGRFLVSAGSTLDLWFVPTGEQVTRLSGFGAFNGACFSLDGSYLLWLTSFDGELCLVETATAQVALTLEVTHAQLTSAAFSPDGRQFAAGFVDGDVEVWNLDASVSGQDSRSLETLWELLRGDAGSAWEAAALLTRRGDQFVEFLAERVRPIDGSPERVEQLLTALSCDDIEARTAAVDELERLGESKVARWKTHLASEGSPEAQARIKELIERFSRSPQVPGGERLRGLRVVSVLERIGGKEAQGVLERLASGAEYADETEAAKLAIQRLERRQGQ